MVVRFDNFISASLFASEKREQGYYAEVMHIHTGHFWGDIASKGFPVLVSEYALADGEEEPPALEATSVFPCWLGWVFYLFTRGVFLLLGLWMACQLARLFYYAPQTAIASAVILAVYALLALIGFLLLTSYSLCLQRTIEIYRDREHRLHRALRVSVFILAIVLVFLKLIAI